MSVIDPKKAKSLGFHLTMGIDKLHREVGDLDDLDDVHERLRPHINKALGYPVGTGADFIDVTWYLGEHPDWLPYGRESQPVLSEYSAAPGSYTLFWIKNGQGEEEGSIVEDERIEQRTFGSPQDLMVWAAGYGRTGRDASVRKNPRKYDPTARFRKSARARLEFGDLFERLALACAEANSDAGYDPTPGELNDAGTRARRLLKCGYIREGSYKGLARGAEAVILLEPSGRRGCGEPPFRSDDWAIVEAVSDELGDHYVDFVNAAVAAVYRA